MPDSYAQSDDGTLYIANGIDRVIKWDGFMSEAALAGVDAPTTPVTLSQIGVGTEEAADRYAFVRFVDDRGNYSNLSPISEVLSFEEGATIRYSDVPVPVQESVVRRQILRNTSGQASVFYVDIDTEDLTSTTFTSDLPDYLLSTGEFQALLDEDNRDLSTIYGIPPDDKSVIASHLDRLFLAGEELYDQGNVAVELGSTQVTGIGTEWPENFAGRFLWADGADAAYEIQSVDVGTQTLTLTQAYGSLSSPYSTYAIRPPIAQRRLVYFSEPGLPEAWWPFSAVAVQEDGDQITGLMPKGSFVYILEKRHVYRHTFQEDPLKDGYVFLTIGRGALNHRCWVVVDEVSYLLDEQGPYAFTGGNESEPIGEPIQDIFQPGGAGPYRVQWQASRWFHACYDPGRQVVRFFVTLSGSGIPRHALAYEVRQKRWWVEEYPFPVGASCTATFRGRRRVFVGGPGGKVFLLGEGKLDQVDSTAGTVRGTATGAEVCSLSDSGATFGPDLVNATLTIVSGKGKRQRRKVVSVSSTTLRVDAPWLDRPDETSVYQLGGVRWLYRTGWFRWAPTARDEEGPRRLEIVFEPGVEENILEARLFRDRARTPVIWDYSYSSADGDGFATKEGDPDLTADLTKPIGLVQRRLDDHKEFYIDGPRFISLELDGAANSEGTELVALSIDGAVPEGGTR